MNSANDIIRQSVIDWFERVVLGENLCPFAHKPHARQAIQFELTQASNEADCLADLYLQLHNMEHNPGIETVLLIVPNCLGRFEDYLDFLELADRFIAQEGWAGVFQIASFHPDYQFSDAPHDDHANWTNRSPFPLLHLLRERSLSAAIDTHPDVEGIPARNIQRLRGLDDAHMQGLFGSRFRKKDLSKDQ